MDNTDAFDFDQTPNSDERWVRRVTTDSTHPPRGTFTGSAAQIARTMARKHERMYGKNLSARRRAELERAKRILQRKAARQKSATTKKR